MIRSLPHPTGVLGSTRTLQADSAEALHDAVESFVDSSNDAGARQLWPLVNVVRAQGPWEALSGGVVLVDAPGVQGARADTHAPPVHPLTAISSRRFVLFVVRRSTARRRSSSGLRFWPVQMTTLPAGRLCGTICARRGASAHGRRLAARALPAAPDQACWVAGADHFADCSRALLPLAQCRRMPCGS